MVLSNTFPDAAYIFLAESKPENQTYEEYRKYRVARLLAYCKVAILRATDAKHIVGVAFDSIDPNRQGGSEDLIYLDASARTPAMEGEAREVQSEFGIMLDQNVKTVRFRGNEYPKTAKDALRIDPEEVKRTTQTHFETPNKRKKRKNKMQKDSRGRNCKKK